MTQTSHRASQPPGRANDTPRNQLGHLTTERIDAVLANVDRSRIVQLTSANTVSAGSLLMLSDGPFRLVRLQNVCNSRPRSRAGAAGSAALGRHKQANEEGTGLS
jgi:hypothetical protein